MKAYEAWHIAKLGQKIKRADCRSPLFIKESNATIPLMLVFGIDFSANDWEVVREKESLTFFSTLEELPQGVPARVPGNTGLRITIEWET